MAKSILVIAVISILLVTCRSDNECTSTISNTSEIIFTCLSEVVINELPLYNYTTSELANITSIVVNGPNETTPGPFTSIPPNICLLSNLKSIDFSNNRIQQVDPSNALSACLSNVITLDVSYNNISEFPSVMIYHMPTLKNLYFQHNQLIDVPGNAFLNISNLDVINFSYNYLTNFEFWAFEVTTTADFSNNQISMITNKYFFNMPSNTSPQGQRRFYLNNNSLSINLTDAVYEIYNSCEEVIETLDISPNNGTITVPGLSYNLAFLDLGTTQINCSCDQSYIIQMFISTFARIVDMAGFPIYNATCIGGTQKFVYSTCPTGVLPSNSSVDFASIYPRQCKIRHSEGGALTSAPSNSPPTANVSMYPHYETKLMNPGSCFFTFSNSSSVRIKCTTDLSTSSTIPSDLLSSIYLSNITNIDFTYSISSLPSYLCSLPSRNIDLSFQSFTTLSDATFPCLDWFHTVKLSYNKLTSVNMSNGNFTNLNSLDLSSNYLTVLPYSILHPTPTSLHFLNLRNNSITSIDLFFYTLKNITIDLRDNPINTSSIINSQNVTLIPENNTTSTLNITFPSSVTNSTYIFNDQTALTAGTCNIIAILNYRNILRSTFNNILLDCTCASLTLRDIFLRSGSNIIDYFNCSNPSTATSFYTLTTLSCGSSALNFTSGLCYNESLQSYPDNISIEFLNTSSLTIFIINSSLSSIIKPNQQYTNSSESHESYFDWHTPQTTNTSNQLPAIYAEPIISKNNSDLEVTSSISSLLFMSNATTPIFDDSMITDMGWTTTTTTTTTSTTTSSSTSTSSSSSTSTSSTSTSTTTSSTTTTTTVSTSTSTTTSSTTTSSTSTSTTSTRTTTSTSSTSTSTSSSTSSTTTTGTTTTTTTTTSTTATTSTTTVSTSTASSTVSNKSFGIIQSNDSSSNRTGLIVGVVLGLVGGLALIGGAITAIVYKKKKAASAAAAMNKPVGRAVMANQSATDTHLQSKNLRTVRLAPLVTHVSKLPPPSTIANAPSFHRSNAPTNLKGIPLRLDPIRSPTSIVPNYYTLDPSVSNNGFSFRPITNPFTQQPQEPKARPHQTLNIGGDTRH